MKIEQNQDSRYDIDLSTTGIELDMNGVNSPEYEIPCLEMLQSILTSTIEIKHHTKTLHTGNLFIEYQVKRKGILGNTGILTTQAEWWMLMIGENTCQFYKTSFFKYLYEHRLELEIETKDNSYEKDYIGYGLIIPLTRIKELLNKYKTSQQEKTLKEIRKKLYTIK